MGLRSAKSALACSDVGIISCLSGCFVCARVLSSMLFEIVVNRVVVLYIYWNMWSGDLGSVASGLITTPLVPTEWCIASGVLRCRLCLWVTPSYSGNAASLSRVELLCHCVCVCVWTHVLVIEVHYGGPYSPTLYYNTNLHLQLLQYTAYRKTRTGWKYEPSFHGRCSLVVVQCYTCMYYILL